MIPQIDNNKSPEEPLHASMLLPYPPSTPFGNLQLAQIELIGRIDYINTRLDALYKKYATLPREGFLPPQLMWIRLEIEEIVYGIRKVLDTLIAMSFIIGEHKDTGEYPQKIQIDSIGPLLARLKKKGKRKPYIAVFSPHAQMLELMNDISNTYKHHFVNYETVNVLGTGGLSAYYLTMDHNDSRDPPQFSGICLSKLVDSCSELLGEVRAAHREWLLD